MPINLSINTRFAFLFEHECPLIVPLIFFFALGRRIIVPNILVDFALACLWGRGFGGINLGVCVVSCKFGKDLVEGI